jgi:hypothetical protein
MITKRVRTTRAFARAFAALAAAGALVVLPACASGPVQLPESRPLVLHSGARLQVDDDERMSEIYESLERQLDAIQRDPTFLIAVNTDARDVYPWETLEIEGDTARIAFQRTAPDLSAAYEVYAHLHLMRVMGRLDEWLPDVAEAEGWELERAIVDRATDVWLLGRAVFDLAPYGLMDRLAYAQDAGYLDALLLTLRASEFPEARAAWLEANPGADEAFRAWHRQTFEEDPPRVPGGAGG